jgi:hypothetical protein
LKASFRPRITRSNQNSKFSWGRTLEARRERRDARIWFFKPLCKRLNLLGKRLNLLLEFLDFRFVTGDEGLDKITSWLGFRWEFEAMLGKVHPSI